MCENVVSVWETLGTSADYLAWRMAAAAIELMPAGVVDESETRFIERAGAVLAVRSWLAPSNGEHLRESVDVLEGKLSEHGYWTTWDGGFDIYRACAPVAAGELDACDVARDASGY